MKTSLEWKKLLYLPFIYRRHGSRKPGMITLPGSTHKVVINPADDRAYKKLVIDTARKRISTPMLFWRDHAAYLTNPLCMDIGANYGECMAYAEYKDAYCVAVEANPGLLAYLEQTRQLHPDSKNISIESCLMGDVDGVGVEFYYSEKWTGGGSAVLSVSHTRKAQVISHTLDHICAKYHDARHKALLLKMDVEGYEGKVFDGFTNINRWPNIAGIMEFDSNTLLMAGTNPRALFDSLADRFSMFLTFRRCRNLKKLNSWQELEAHYKNGGIHCDIAFFSSDSMISPRWTILDQSSHQT